MPTVEEAAVAARANVLSPKCLVPLLHLIDIAGELLISPL